MSQTTPIEWTDVTWNPVRGCSRISPGCVNCYAERIAARFSRDGEYQRGRADLERKPDAFHGFAIRIDSGPRWTGKVELVETHLLDPLKWRTPRRCFVNSMSDLFHENLPDESIDRIFAVMALTPHITYQILTKRAGRMRKWFEGDGRPRWSGHVYNRTYALSAVHQLSVPSGWPLPNVHLGVSVENQQTADERIPELLRTPAAIRFISYEPALESVEFLKLGNGLCALTGWLDTGSGYKIPPELRGVDWVIIGGESGPGARPFCLKWARDTISACKAAGVPVFLKQIGSRPIGEDASDLAFIVAMKNKKGGDPLEWPPDLRNAREFPKSNVLASSRVGSLDRA